MSDTLEEQIEKLNQTLVAQQFQLNKIVEWQRAHATFGLLNQVTQCTVEGMLAAGRLSENGKEWLDRARHTALAQISVENQPPNSQNVKAAALAADLFDRIELAAQSAEGREKMI